VRSRVGPDRAAHRARDGQPELETAQAGVLGQRRRAGHGQARIGGQAIALDARLLCPIEDGQAGHPGVGDDQVGAAAQDEEGHRTRASEAHQRAQLE
jgi:hypothetical protein